MVEGYIREIEGDEDDNTIEIIPVPHFVVKSKIFTPYKLFETGSKIFLNICSNLHIPTKEIVDETTGQIIEDFRPGVLFDKIAKGEWEIPILISKLRDVKDNKNNKSLLIECIINDKYLKWCLINESLKDILVQWCFDAIEFQIGGNFLIDRDFIKFPKRESIGEKIPKMFINIDKINKDTKELEDLSKDLYEGDEDPINFIKIDEHKENEERELSSLIGNKEGKSNLIVEVDDFKLDKKLGKKLDKKLDNVKERKISLKEYRFEVKFRKLEDNYTRDNYKYEMIIIPQFENIDMEAVRFRFDKDEKELKVYYVNECKIEFPMPLDIIGDNYVLFYLKPERHFKLYI